MDRSTENEHDVLVIKANPGLNHHESQASDSVTQQEFVAEPNDKEATALLARFAFAQSEIPDRRFTRRISIEGHSTRIEYTWLPDQLTTGFYEAEPDESLALIRAYTTGIDSRAIAKSTRSWTRHARHLEQYLDKENSHQPVELDDDIFEAARRNMLGIYSLVLLNADKTENIAKLNDLMKTYMRDVQEISSLGFRKPHTVALSYSPDECAQALEHYQSLGVKKGYIIRAFANKANSRALLDRFAEWLPKAKEKYSTFQDATIDELVFQASTTTDEDEVERKMNQHLGKMHEFEQAYKDLGIETTDNGIARSARTFRTSNQSIARTLDPALKFAYEKGPHRFENNKPSSEAFGYSVFPERDPYAMIWLTSPEQNTYDITGVRIRNALLTMSPNFHVVNDQGYRVEISMQEKLAITLFSMGATVDDVESYALRKTELRSLKHRLNITQDNPARPLTTIACQQLLLPKDTDPLRLSESECVTFAKLADTLASGVSYEKCAESLGMSRVFLQEHLIEYFNATFSNKGESSALITIAHVYGLLAPNSDMKLNLSK